MAPFLLAHLSDSHLGADWGGGDPVARLAATVAAVLEVRPRPDAVLVSGDIADHGDDAEYTRARELLEPLGAPLYALPGNHDDRAALRRAFEVPGDGAEPIQYAVDLGPLRLVVLDTTIPGEDPGALDAKRLAWLDAELAAAPDAPTLVAMHHPPIAVGIPAWDDIGMPAGDRAALGDVVARHPHVRRLVAGHVHWTITDEVAGRVALTVPSTYVPARPDFVADEIQLTTAPPGFAVHSAVDGNVISFVEQVA